MISITRPTTTQKLLSDLQWEQYETLQSIAEKTSLSKQQLDAANAGAENEQVFQRLFRLWCRNDLHLDDIGFPPIMGKPEIIHYADKHGV